MRVDAVEMADPEGHRLAVARAQLDTAAAAHAARAAAHTTRVRLLDAPPPSPLVLSGHAASLTPY